MCFTRDSEKAPFFISYIFLFLIHLAPDLVRVKSDISVFKLKTEFLSEYTLSLIKNANCIPFIMTCL